MGNNWMELGLTKDEEEFVRRGAELYKITYLSTIDNIFVIARSLKILHDHYHSSGVKGGFSDALVQYGFTARDGGPMNKAIVSHHGQLLAHEAEVRAWWEKVPERVKRDWLSAKAIHSHWTKSKKPPREPSPPTKLAEARPQETEAEVVAGGVHKQLAQAQTRIAELEDENYKFRVELGSQSHVIKTRDGGGLTKAQFGILEKCCHPDNSASAETRTKGIRLLRQLRYVVCNEAELPTMDRSKFHISFQTLWKRRQETIRQAKKHAKRRQPKASPKPPKSLSSTTSPTNSKPERD